MCLIVNSDGYKILTTAVKGREEEHKKIKYLIEEIKQQSRNKGKTMSRKEKEDPNRKFKKYRYELKKLERKKTLMRKRKNDWKIPFTIISLLRQQLAVLLYRHAWIIRIPSDKSYYLFQSGFAIAVVKRMIFATYLRMHSQGFLGKRAREEWRVENLMALILLLNPFYKVFILSLWDIKYSLGWKAFLLTDSIVKMAFKIFCTSS